MRRWLLLLCVVYGISQAQLPNGRNHPELRWFTFKTHHFEIIFHQGLDSLAFEAAKVAEEVYDPITRNLGVTLKKRTPIILSDVDDISNGIANPLNNTIFIWTRSDKKETTGSLHWLKRVIGHEFAHIATFRGCRNFLGKPWELLTLGLTPTWFLEGVAQYESETWDDHRDLLLRAAVRDSALLPPRKLDGFVGADPVDGRLVYEEGHGLVRHIATKYGKEKIRELVGKHRRFPISFTWTMKRTLGKTTGHVFQEWEDEVERSADRVYEEKESGTEIGEKMSVPLQVVTGFRWSRDGERMAVVGMERWDEGVQRLYVKERNGSRWRRMGGPNAGSYFSWSSDGNRLIVSRKRRGRHGSFVDDLFLIDIRTGEEKRITDDLRASDPIWSPTRDEVCYVRQHTGESALWMLYLETNVTERLTNIDGIMEVFSPSWSLDGEWLTFSFIDIEGRRDIGIIRRDGTGFMRLTSDPVDDRTPTWSPDGEVIAFCRYENGVPNLFRMQIDGSNVKRLTDAAGGIFNPEWAPDGEHITAVVFEGRKSVGVHLIPASKRITETAKIIRPAWTMVEPHEKESGQWDSKSSAISRSLPYRSWAHLKPLITFPFAGMDDGGLQAGLIHYAADPLYKHQFLGTLTARKRVDWMFEYVNGQWEPLVTLAFWGRTQGGDAYILEDGPELWERRYGGEVRLSLPMNFGRTLLSNHWINFSVRGERVHILYEDRFSILKPAFRPFSGWVNSIALGYAWAWERPDVGFGVHPSTGCFFSASLVVSDQAIGSDIERTRAMCNVAVRQELPWSRHVFGVRMGGLFQWGEQPIQDRLSLGSPEGVRAMSFSREGDRFLYGSAEYRIPLIRDLGFRIPIFYFERFAWAFWSDWGKAWGSNLTTYETGVRRSYGEADWVLTVGGELRCRIYLWGKLPVVVRGGYGKEILGGGDGNWYWLFGPIF